jgi:hypothetical protein
MLGWLTIRRWLACGPSWLKTALDFRQFGLLLFEQSIREDARSLRKRSIVLPVKFPQSLSTFFQFRTQLVAVSV